MSKKNFSGTQKWEGYHTLCRPLELMGVDRRLFGILTIVFMVFWQGMDSLFLAISVSYGMFWAFRFMTKADPQFFSVLRGASTLPAAWYEAADAPSKYGPYIVRDNEELRHLDDVKRLALRRRSRTGLRGRFLEIVSLVTGSGEDD